MKNSFNARILIVDDDYGHRAMLETIIQGWGYKTEVADSGTRAVEWVKEMAFEAILMDIRMPGIDGTEALQQILYYNPAIPVVMMTAYSTVESAVEAIKIGAYDYLMKPLDFDILKHTLKRTLEHSALKQENSILKEQTNQDPLQKIIGRSESIRKLLELISTVAPSEAIVLISGESGTGKELVAKAIHALSSRSNAPFVAINCAALNETLLESELFGHEKGAFTGAEKRRDGRFLSADKGTLFLDEVGEISHSVQVKLLRTLQEYEIQRVGSDEVIPINVRIVAATNKDLKVAVADKVFREDLYYRLNVVQIIVPPLRERKEDIPLLATHFLNKFAKQNRKEIKGFSPQAMDMLLKYSWPGNVREFENAIERAVVLLSGEYIVPRELPQVITEQNPENPFILGDMLGNISLDEVEREVIIVTLESVSGNKSEAARRLGITRKTLHSKLVKYEIE